MRKDAAAVRALVKDGKDVNAAQGDGMTALHWAAMNGDAELDRHAALRRRERAAPPPGWAATPPLHLAAQAGKRRDRAR